MPLHPPTEGGPNRPPRFPNPPRREREKTLIERGYFPLIVGVSILVGAIAFVATLMIATVFLTRGTL